MDIASPHNRGIETLSNFIEHVVSWEVRDFAGVSAVPHLEGTVVRVQGASTNLYIYPTSPTVLRTCRVNGTGKIVEHIGEYEDTGAVPGGTHAYIADIIHRELNTADPAA